MKTLFLLIFTTLVLFGELEVNGYVGLESQFFLTKPDSKKSSNFTAQQSLDIKYYYKDLTLSSTLYAQEDYDDSLDESENTKRTFARLDELYAKYDFEDDSIQAGKSIKFWGSLEFMNIVDVFNPDDFRSDILDSSKLGVWNASYTHFSEDSEISATVKFHEQSQRMAERSYIYYILPSYLEYDDSLKTSDGNYRPSIYIIYSGSLESEYAVDFAFIYENGYDSQRYFGESLAISNTLVQNAYTVNKFMTFNTLVVGATLIKVEALYADVIEDKRVSDYSHIALGVEHTFESVYEDSSLGLIVEYYRYDMYESGKLSDLELFQTMQNDIFTGIRYSFNDLDDSSIVAGVVSDFEYDERLYFAKYESRLGDLIKLKADYTFISPSREELTAYSALGKHQRIGVNFAYYY